LDIGCGNGALSYDLARKVNFVVGVDIKADTPLLNLTLRKRNLAFTVKNIVDCHKCKVDVIVLSNIIEHLPDRIKILKGLKKSAKKFLVRVPMIDRDWLTLYKKELGVEYRLDKGHFIEYTEQSFRDEVKEAGYKIVKLEIRFGEIYAILK
jgi:2-polyprenyl-3-methyl-5-hydroxy-6-metoxy-1,4-benzoquinol methylase